MEFWKRFRRDRLAVAGLFVIAVFVLAAIAAPVIAPFDPSEQFSFLIVGKLSGDLVFKLSVVFDECGAHHESVERTGIQRVAYCRA